MSEEEIAAPGWDAIDSYVGSRYGHRLPHQFTSSTPYELDKANPLPAVTVWESGAPPSWHYVSYGLTELFEKSSSDPNISGFGHELTLRVPKADGEEQPPAWGVRLLNALGHHILSQRAGLDSGHCVDLGAPLTMEESCCLTGLVCIPDPILGKFDSPHGSVLFLQLVGITAAELAIFKDLELPDLVAAIAELSPSGLSDPARACWCEDAEKSKVMKRYKVGLKL